MSATASGLAFGFEDLLWPLARLGEGLDLLARRAGLGPGATEALGVPASMAAGRPGELAAWVEWAGARLGVEIEPVEADHADAMRLVRDAAPAVLRLDGPDGAGVVLLLGARGGHARLLGPDHRVHRRPLAQLREALCARLERPLVSQVDDLLDAARVPARRRGRARDVMLRQRLATERVGGCWLLRLPASADFRRQLTHAGVPRRLAGMLLAFGVVYALEAGSWGLIGNAVLDGRLDFGWLIAWFLLMATLVPLQLAGTWFDGTFALEAGRLLKQRLLAGALRLDAEAVRRQGAGDLLGRVMESQALESLAVNGGLSVLVALLELALAAWVLALGAGGGLHVALLAGWCVVAIATGGRYVQRLRRWTEVRLALTRALVERMTGHRTCLAQERPARRDASQDQALGDYLATSAAMDRAALPATSLVSSGWMLVGIAGLVPAFVAGGATAAGLAIGLGGILLANRALSGITGGLASLGRAAFAWDQVAPLFRAAATAEAPAAFQAIHAPRDAPLIEACGLSFRYRAEGSPVLAAADLRIRHGDRILLEGPSGGGKSTLASLLTGLRRPDAGLLLLEGLDRHTLGEAWHRFATSAPQFHENHVLSGTLAFNLLMGRDWPADEPDVEDARQLCAALGLDELLARMPSGLVQTVGETGWQLSHGERSRVFLARALLQRARLTVMDESFAALDPETLRRCLRCALARDTTLVVIAHP